MRDWAHVAIAALLLLSSCAGEPSETPQTVDTAEASPPTSTAPSQLISTTTSSSVASSSSTSTTTSSTFPSPVSIEHELRVYEPFEAVAEFELDEPCLAVGEINPVRDQARVTVWSENGDSVVTGGLLSSGTIQYDSTGPPIGDPGHELFYYCSFIVELDGLPQHATFRFEYPGQEELSGVTTTEDLLSGAFTGYTVTDRETERQRLRAEQ